MPSSSIRRTLTQMRRRTVAVHRRWYRYLWASTTLAVESPTDLFVASHWLDRSSCRFPVTLLEYRSSRSQYFTNINHLSFGFYHNFYWRFASKASMSIRPPLIGSTAVTSRSRLLAMHVVFRSLLKIFVYAAKQACKQLQCNKAKLLAPAHNQKGLG